MMGTVLVAFSGKSMANQWQISGKEWQIYGKVVAMS
jgi:hypothetical protein